MLKSRSIDLYVQSSVLHLHELLGSEAKMIWLLFQPSNHDIARLCWIELYRLHPGRWDNPLLPDTEMCLELLRENN